MVCWRNRRRRLAANDTHPTVPSEEWSTNYHDRCKASAFDDVSVGQCTFPAETSSDKTWLAITTDLLKHWSSTVGGSVLSTTATSFSSVPFVHWSSAFSEVTLTLNFGKLERVSGWIISMLACTYRRLNVKTIPQMYVHFKYWWTDKFIDRYIDTDSRLRNSCWASKSVFTTDSYLYILYLRSSASPTEAQFGVYRRSRPIPTQFSSLKH